MDDRALRTQLESHHRESYGWALGCCRGDREDADAALQSAYLKVLEKKAVFNGRAAFKTWFFAVVRKTAAEERRRSYFRRLLLDRYRQGRRAASTEPSPEEALTRDEMQEVFRRALLALSRRQREALQLVFYHDLSVAEAAEVMGVSLGAARRHYERGKRRLREKLEEKR